MGRLGSVSLSLRQTEGLMHPSMLGNFREGKGSNFHGSVDTGTHVPSYLVLC